jgi:hypothetical protein
MAYSVDALQILRRPEVRTYLINAFGIGSPEQSYERVIEFFTRHREIEQEVARLREDATGELDPKVLVSAAAKELGYWDPERILDYTGNSIRKGLARFRVSQHGDGGWGYHWETSSTWATAHALLALGAARGLNIEVDSQMVERGFSWLTTNYKRWSLSYIPADGWSSIYEASLVIRCFVCSGRTFRETDLSLQEIANRQSAGGGWDPSYHGPEVKPARELDPETGATSMAIQALASAGKGEFNELIEKGVRWILNAQDPDGYWRSGPNDDPPGKANQPSLSKTCDALSGIAAARAASTTVDCSEAISKALNWILEQEKFLSSSSGWGYDQVHDDGEKRSDLVSTCLVLEALVQTEGVALPLITPYAQLLMAAQTDQPGNVEDGNWHRGDTFRITLALIEYWIKVKAGQSALQEIPVTPAPASVNSSSLKRESAAST